MPAHRLISIVSAIFFALILCAGQLLDGPSEMELEQMVATDLEDAKRMALECYPQPDDETHVALTAATEGDIQ